MDYVGYRLCGISERRRLGEVYVKEMKNWGWREEVGKSNWNT